MCSVMTKSLIVLMLSTTVAAVAGCNSDSLEDGYKYSALSMNETQKKAMYSSPFSQDSRAAEQEQKDNLRARRPGQY